MEIPQTLKAKLASKKVIPLVGAGVSMAILRKENEDHLFPSWKELLNLAAERLEREGKNRDAVYVRSALVLDEPDFLSIASHAKKQLGPAWSPFLTNVFNPSRETIHEGSLSLPRLIWNMGSRLVITTNYDKILRWACPNTDDCETWNIEHKAELATFLADQRPKTPTVWHLHGCIEDASRIILTSDGYKLLYGDDNSQEVYEAALHAFRSALSSHTFLFIGFSFNDEHLGVQFRGIDSIFDGCTGPHYALIREEEKSRLRELKLPIEPITFSDFGQPLIDRLEELARYAASATKTFPATTPVPSPPTPDTPPPVQSRYSPANPVFHVPFAQKGDQVVGREEILARVRQQLTEGKRTAIGHTASFQGLGGLGKTQLAIEYAYEYRNSYHNGVIWLNADQDIDAQLTELAVSAAWIAPESEHKDKLSIARHRLKTYGDCLIIFDNLEDQKAISSYLPERQDTTHILVTSRMDQPGFTPIPLDPLDPERSLELLYQDACRTAETPEEETAAREIVSILGGLPLAIELAGAYLCHRRTYSFSDYLERLRDDPLKALPKQYLTSFTDHDPDLLRTLRINEELFDEEPLLTPILELLTWSGPASIGIDFMAHLLDGSLVDLRGALALGVELRIIQKTPDMDRYAIHRLVREVRKIENPLKGRTDWIEATANRVGNWFQSLRENFNDLPRFEAEIDHLNTWCDSCHVFPLLNARLTWLQAYPPYHRGDYAKAHETVTRALNIVEQEKAEPNELHAHIYNDFGTTLGFIGDSRSSLHYQEQALAIRTSLFGEDHPDTATSYSNVGSTYGALGDHKKALEFKQKALDIQRALFGDDHPDTAGSYNNVGSTYGELGDHPKALELKQKALNILRALFGDDHPDTATSYSNVGSTYGALGDHKKALEFKQKALDIRRALFSDDHPDTAGSYNNIGSTYGALGNHKKALELKQKALDIRRALFGDDHPNIAISLNNIAGSYYHLGKHQLASEALRKAVRIARQIFPEKHPTILLLENNINAINSCTKGFRTPPRKKKKR
jgi:tetratricopeptide (TPR) repeat protein